MDGGIVLVRRSPESRAEYWESRWREQYVELVAARAERDEALRVARDAVRTLQGSVSLWPRDYPAWLVYALLGDDSPLPRSDILIEENPYSPVRALVGLVGEGS